MANNEIFDSRFLVLCDCISALFSTDISSNSELNFLKLSYQSNVRYYHNINHILTLLKYYDSIRIKMFPIERLAIQFAIYYHDIVYDVNQSDEINVYESKIYAIKALKNLRTEKGRSFKDLVGSLIMATNHSYLFSNLYERNLLKTTEKYMSDMDLCQLAAEPLIFNKNNANIEKEYTLFTSQEKFRKGNKLFLEKVLSLDSIFLTEEFKVYENNARKNIEHLLEERSKQT